MRVRSFTAAALLLAGFPAVVLGQSWPEGWEARADHAGADLSEVEFVTMEPGWHITTGPATILYDPTRTASGEFRVESEVFLFDPEGRREAFGFFVGGRDLQGPGQEYVYFLIRPTGEFLIKRRTGSTTTDVQGWTAHGAVVPWSGREPGSATARNVLAIEAGAETVRFLVNGSVVASRPRQSLRVDGIVGLRINHMLNIHVTSLEVTSPK